MSGNDRSVEPAEGRVALVSDSDQGVGPRIVRLLAGQGMRVVSASRSVQRARLAIDALDDLADRVAVRQLDSTDPTSVARLVSWMADRLGRCDVLVNTAAVRLVDDRDVATVPPEAMRRIVDADLVGTRRLIRAVVPLMRKNRYGRIVNVFGMSDGRPRPPQRLPAYDVSASALSALTRGLAAELADDGILVNAYWPDATTPTSWTLRGRRAWRAWLHRAAPADAVLWLAMLPEDGPTGVVYTSRVPGARRGFQ